MYVTLTWLHNNCSSLEALNSEFKIGCNSLIFSASVNIQLMLGFLKALCLVLHFSYYTLMAFLMMLFVILQSMLMILLSTLSVIRQLICENNLG